MTTSAGLRELTKLTTCLRFAATDKSHSSPMMMSIG